MGTQMVAMIATQKESSEDKQKRCNDKGLYNLTLKLTMLVYVVPLCLQ